MKANLKLQYGMGYIYPRCYILVKEECTHYNQLFKISSILHVLYVNLLILFFDSFTIIFMLISFYLKPKLGIFPLY
jgi:hypothetical protein